MTLSTDDHDGQLRSRSVKLLIQSDLFNELLMELKNLLLVVECYSNEMRSFLIDPHHSIILLTTFNYQQYFLFFSFQSEEILLRVNHDTTPLHSE